MPTVLDWQHLERKIEACSSSTGIQSRGKAFCYVVMQSVFVLEYHEISEHLTDGGNDFGIDAIFIDRTASPASIHVMQFKCHEKYKAQNRSYPETATEKVTNFFACLMQRDEHLGKKANPKLREKVKEIYEIIEQETPSFHVHMCSNGAKLIESQFKAFQERLAPYGGVEIHEHDIETIISRFVDNKRPKFDAKIVASGKEIFERADGNIHGLVATVSGDQLIKLISHSQYENRINEAVFHDNVRVFLGFSVTINDNIYKSAISELNYKFWYLNNGITIVCDRYEYQPQLYAPTISLENYQIVNGRQTSNAIFESYLQYPEKVADISILLRIYATRDIEVTRSIAEATNSQSRINSRNLRSTDSIQRQLADFFSDRGLKYQRVPKEFEGLPSNQVVDAFKLGQVCLAYYEGAPERARTTSDEIFDRYYSDIFNKNFDFEGALKVYQTYQQIESRIEDIDESVRQGKYPIPYYFAAYARFHFIYTIRLLCERDEIDIEEFDVDSRFEEVAKIIGRVLSDEHRSSYEVFRSSRTRERIAGVIRGDQRDLFD